MKREEQRSEMKRVAVGKSDGTGDGVAPAPGAVLASEVLEDSAFGRYHQPCVTARDGRCIEADLDVRIAPDDVLAYR